MPPWLAELQSRFGTMVRTPLDRTSGFLRASTASYEPGLVRETRADENRSGRQRLATYNRQYWFRLFGVLHSAFPLTTRLLGHWTFNEYACRFIVAHPPQGWDIETIALGFDEFLAKALVGKSIRVAPPAGGKLEGEALVEAARIDAAFFAVFRAPHVAPYVPAAEDAARLLTGCLVLSPAAALLSERWPLCELRRELSGCEGEAPVPLPPRLRAVRHWLLLRRQLQIGQIPLEAGEHRLLTLLTQHAVGEALALLEREWPEETRSSLPPLAQRWLARSVELGLWSKLADQK
jgi:Putative DNA-binding domain